MEILNMDRSRCGIVIDLSNHLPQKNTEHSMQHLKKQPKQAFRSPPDYIHATRQPTEPFWWLFCS